MGVNIKQRLPSLRFSGGRIILLSLWEKHSAAQVCLLFTLNNTLEVHKRQSVLAVYLGIFTRINAARMFAFKSCPALQCAKATKFIHNSSLIYLNDKEMDDVPLSTFILSSLFPLHQRRQLNGGKEMRRRKSHLYSLQLRGRTDEKRSKDR